MINYESYSKFVEHNELDLEYYRVTQDVFDIEDVDSALEIIFQYHRKKGFPHYNIPTHKRLQQFKSLQRFDEQTLFKNGKILNTTKYGCGFDFKLNFITRSYSIHYLLLTI